MMKSSTEPLATRSSTTSQIHSIQCVDLMKNIKNKGNYNEIFTNNISYETAAMLMEITDFRENIEE